MAIVTATRIEAAPQVDGRLAVRELHQSDAGDTEERAYVASAGADLDSMMVANSALFLQRLATKGMPNG